MRKIKFKAKRVIYGDWAEGCYYISNERHFIKHPKSNTADEINPNTICQFTGLYDRNGREIYDWDIVKYTIGVPYEEIDDILSTVIYSIEDARYMLVNDDEYINEEFDSDTCKNSEIISNIHNK